MTFIFANPFYETGFKIGRWSLIVSSIKIPLLLESKSFVNILTMRVVLLSLTLVGLSVNEYKPCSKSNVD